MGSLTEQRRMRNPFSTAPQHLGTRSASLATYADARANQQAFAVIPECAPRHLNNAHTCWLQRRSCRRRSTAIWTSRNDSCAEGLQTLAECSRRQTLSTTPLDKVAFRFPSVRRSSSRNTHKRTRWQRVTQSAQWFRRHSGVRKCHPPQL